MGYLAVASFVTYWHDRDQSFHPSFLKTVSLGSDFVYVRQDTDTL